MHVVWDFGGVLVRWRPADLLRTAWPHLITDDDTAARWRQDLFRAADDWAAFDRGLLDAAELTARVTARTSLTAGDMAALLDAVGRELVPLPEPLDLVARLDDGGVTQFFLSNMPAPYADALDAHDALAGRFADGVYSARVGLAKPEPEIFAVAAERFGADPADLLFFDDLPVNVAAARAAGWQAEVFTGVEPAAAALRERGLL